MDILPVPLTRTLVAIYIPDAACEPLSRLTAQLAIRGSLAVLDGGNCFPAYQILRLVQANAPYPLIAMKRIMVRRAFTCYQMLSLLESSPALPQPCLVLNPLATFYDEQVSLLEIRRLLHLVLGQLERLSRVAPVLVALMPSPATGRGFLVEQVRARVHQFLMLEPPAPQATQLALF